MHRGSVATTTTAPAAGCVVNTANPDVPRREKRTDARQSGAVGNNRINMPQPRHADDPPEWGPAVPRPPTRINTINMAFARPLGQVERRVTCESATNRQNTKVWC